MTEDDLRPTSRPVNPVPDVDDEDGPLEQSIREHLERLTAAAEQDIEALSHEEFDAAITSRLVSAERIQSTGLGFSYATRFADHIHEVLTLDLPTAIVTLPDSRIAETGRRLPTLVDRGRSNLLTLMETTPVDVERVEDGRRSAWTFTGDSPYTASFARFLNDAVHRWLPEADTANGFVFALPHRHTIVLQTCATATQTRDALELVPALAQVLHQDGTSPVSRHTYHWLDRQISCLTEEDGNGGLTLRPTPFLESLTGLSGRRAG
ncbi:MAG TPA: hypothetical protein VFL46_13230 [Phycicoccus sp.]|nr:hypothetical protein [Phycicoccus sp.]